MKKLCHKKSSWLNFSKGMTLIEVIIYIVLLSFLLSGFINYAYAIHIQNINLIHDIQDAQN